MTERLQELKNKLEEKIKVVDERIERRSGVCYFDESEKIESLHTEAFYYEKVIEMIDEIKTQ